MASYKDIDHHVMGMVLRSPRDDMEEAVLECPGLKTNQVSLEPDYLSRPSQVGLKQNRPDHYSLVRQGTRNR